MCREELPVTDEFLLLHTEVLFIFIYFLAYCPIFIPPSIVNVTSLTTEM